MYKKTLSILLSIGLIGSSLLSTTVYANDIKAYPSSDKSMITNTSGTDDVKWYDGYLWELSSVNKNVSIVTQGSYTPFATHIAKKTGETYTAGTSVSYSHNYSGSLSVSSKQVEAQLGYSFGVSKQLSAAATSAPLKANQKIVASYIKTFNQSNINQREIYYVLKNGSYTTYKPTGKTKVAYANEAILPMIKFDYYSNRAAATDNDTFNQYTSLQTLQKPDYSEVYQADENGIYHLCETIK